MYWVTTGVARIMAASGTTRDVGLIECPFRLARRRRLLMDLNLIPVWCRLSVDVIPRLRRVQLHKAESLLPSRSRPTPTDRSSLVRACDGSIRMRDCFNAHHSWHDGAQQHPTPCWLLFASHRDNFPLPRAAILELSGKARMPVDERPIFGLLTTCRMRASCSPMGSVCPPSSAAMKIA